MESETLPCPRCRTDLTERHLDHVPGQEHPMGAAGLFWWVQCHLCTFRGPYAFVMGGALAAWNALERPTIPP